MNERVALAKLQQPVWGRILHSFLKQNFRHCLDNYGYKTPVHQVLGECAPTTSASQTGLAL